MSSKIITISREFGSGGRFIGQQVADRLGIPCYDRELIQLVAKESGYDLSFIEETGEYSASGSFLYSLSMSGIYPQRAVYSEETLPIGDKVHLFQTKVIRETAEKGPCVIVGRCADYILRERTDCLNVFLYADMAFRKERAVRYLEVVADGAEKEIKRKDKARANHYRRYTGQAWGDAKNYHLSIDSALFGVEGCTELILQAAKL